MHVHMNLMGKSFAQLNGESVYFTKKQTMLLAVLSVNNQMELTDIFAILWPGVPFDSARNSFMNLKNQIHEIIGFKLIEFKEVFYRIKQSKKVRFTSDVSDFFDSIKQQNWQAAFQAFEGEFLPGYEDEWVEKIRKQIFEDLQLSVSELLFLQESEETDVDEELEKIGLDTAKILYGKTILKIEPGSDYAVRLLMEGYRIEEAIDTFYEFKNRLEMAGVEPDPQTIECYRRIINV